MLRSSLIVRSRDKENNASLQVARAELAEIEMVQAQNWNIKLEGLLDEFNEWDQKAAKELKEKLRQWRG